MHRNFKKIRITGKKEDDDIQKLLANRLNGNEDELNQDKISNLIYERNRKLIMDQINSTADMSGNLSRVKMWKVKQKVCPKVKNSVPIAKLDEEGNLVSNGSELKELYVRAYKYRLRHRDINPEFSKLKELKENLFEMRKCIAFGRNPKIEVQRK